MIPSLKYGKPTPLSQVDVEKLQKLDETIWNRTKDRFGHTHAFPKDSKKLSKKDQDYILGLIAKHVLPCVLRSGPYGELSFSVWDHSEMPGVPPTRLISLSEEHFGIKATFATWKKSFDEMSKVTHSQRNREVLAFYGLPEPGPASVYEY